MNTAPVVLVTYRRPDHVRRTLEALARNELAAESDLIAFSDGPRSPEEESSVRCVRDLLRSAEGFRSVRVVEREGNLGLARSVTGAVTDALRDHDRVIVMEDDLVTSPYFLRFMNEGLDIYARDEGVASVHGYMYPVDRRLPETFFLRGADCWGWGTWRRAWRHFEPDGRVLLEGLRREGLTRDFDLRGARSLVDMLRQQVSGRNDSWAVRWHASAFLAGLYTLYPGRSLVDNIGTDASGTHCGETDAFSVAPTDRPVVVERRPVQEHPEALAAVRRYFLALQRRGRAARLMAWLRR